SIVMASLPVGAHEITPVALNTLDKIVRAVPSSLAQATARGATPVISPHAESRFPDARLVSRHAGGRVDEVTGVLVSDPEGRDRSECLHAAWASDLCGGAHGCTDRRAL